MLPKIIEIKKHPNYFVTDTGSFYKTGKGTQKKIIPVKTKAGLKVSLTNRAELLVINILLECFYPEYNGYDQVLFKVTNGTINPNHIQFVKSKNDYNLKDEEYKLFGKYKCKSRADNANQRCSHKITGHDVFMTLIRHNFKCHFCNKGLNEYNWQLDHYYALSQGGKNKSDNIVPTCKTCNIMKGVMNGFEFVERCKDISRINENYNSDEIELSSIKSEVGINRKSKANKIPYLVKQINRQIEYYDKKYHLMSDNEIRTALIKKSKVI